jgi:hypothetical protein
LALREWNECCEDADMKGSLCYLPFFPWVSILFSQAW